MEMDPKSTARRTKDHVIPQADGGKVTVFACWQCNNDKGMRTLPMWHAHLERNGDPRAKNVAWFIAEHMTNVLMLEQQLGREPDVIANMTPAEKLIVNAAAVLVFGLGDNQDMTRKQRAKAAYFARDVISILTREGFIAADEERRSA
jgi:hypothetical protein